jgi:predicted HicB family RNase H-like nuclease
MDTVTTKAGDVLTEQDLEALADEAERRHDLTTARRAYIGRPPLGDGGPSPRLQIRVDPKLAKAVRARARKEKRSVSEVARTALREYVGRSSR